MLPTMKYTTYRTTALVSLPVVLLALNSSLGPAQPAAAPPPAVKKDDTPEGTPRARKLELTPISFAKFQARIRPNDNEWRHLKVQWLTDPVAARKKAAAEDKPIIVYSTGGAGYNDPLGTC